MAGTDNRLVWKREIGRKERSARDIANDASISLVARNNLLLDMV
jgi:hypothetical protein